MSVANDEATQRQAVIANREAVKQSRFIRSQSRRLLFILDCFVATLLAMTMIASPLRGSQ
ncbi:MAG: hypothetical protein LBH30_01740 [Prevotellaceae bacterium]|nr:hypothetical protein [Prevotellaceae bacterium]